MSLFGGILLYFLCRNTKEEEKPISFLFLDTVIVTGGFYLDQVGIVQQKMGCDGDYDYLVHNHNGSFWVHQSQLKLKEVRS